MYFILKNVNLFNSLCSFFSFHIYFIFKFSLTLYFSDGHIRFLNKYFIYLYFVCFALSFLRFLVPNELMVLANKNVVFSFLLKRMIDWLIFRVPILKIFLSIYSFLYLKYFPLNHSRCPSISIYPQESSFPFHLLTWNLIHSRF